MNFVKKYQTHLNKIYCLELDDKLYNSKSSLSLIVLLKLG